MTSLSSQTAEILEAISHPEKRLFSVFTKKELVDYYIQVSEIMIDHVKGRPLTLFRFPHGVSDKMFFQKNRPEHFPEWISHKEIAKQKGKVDYIICNDPESLIYVASQIAEFHIWTSTTNDLEHPDKIIFDLDPSKENKSLLKDTVKNLCTLMRKIGLEPFVMTTGKRGYHVVSPIIPEIDHDQVREFALKIAKVIESSDPKNITTELIKDKRGDKIFIDVNRNSPQQTSIAPYSVRAVPGATVALPISKDELYDVDTDSFDIKKTLIRLKTTKDPWRSFRIKETSLKDVIENLKN
jgi:bifunctional non-homologous end joining protein LigD